jgi:hypothetical protein
LIYHIPQEEVLINWPVISEAFAKFWDVGVNFETLPNLKRRLLAESCTLWMWTSEDKKARLLFVTERKITAMAKILTVTHTAGIKSSDTPYSRADLRAMISTLFEEVEDLALTLYFDAVCIHARPAHVKLAKGYKKRCIPIVKQLTNIKRGK